MSACLIGTQPSSGTRDKMGALPQAGTGLGGRAGNQAMAARSGQGAWEEYVLSSLWQGTGPLKLGGRSPLHAPGKEVTAQERISERLGIIEYSRLWSCHSLPANSRASKPVHKGF